MVVFVPFLLLIVFFYSWVCYVFLSYRRGRQEEVVGLLIAVSQSGAPLPVALRAYVRDRPQGGLRELWVAFLLFFVLPGYWFWYRWHNFDQKVLRLAADLEEGIPLHEALLEARGVVSRETVLAAAVGAATGRLTLCLRESQRSSLTPVMLEVMPRFVYPFLVLFAACIVASFYSIFILPRMQRIFFDFHQPLPELTRTMYNTQAWTVGFWFFVMLFVILLPLLIIQLIFIPASRWYFPGIAGVYRNFTLGWAMRMLGSLLEAGMSVPLALEFLIGSGYFVTPAKQRLAAALEKAEDGASLSDALRRGGVVRRNMTPLIQAAERANNLPWALSQLGASRANRAVVWLRRVSQLISPTSVIALGMLVGTLVLAGFLPLLTMLGILNDG
jgi:type II secretory pathway component PulF